MQSNLEVTVNIVYHVNAIIIICRCSIKYILFRSSVVSKHYSFCLLEVFDVYITASLRAGI